MNLPAVAASGEVWAQRGSAVAHWQAWMSHSPFPSRTPRFGKCAAAVGARRGAGFCRCGESVPASPGGLARKMGGRGCLGSCGSPFRRGRASSRSSAVALCVYFSASPTLTAPLGALRDRSGSGPASQR